MSKAHGEISSVTPSLGVAAGLMILVGAINSIDSIIVRTLTTDLHPFVIGFFRALFGLLVVLPWIVRSPSRLRTRYRLSHLVRAALKLLSLVAFFAAIAAAPLADVTAIAFAAPIFVTIGAWVFLGEAPMVRRVLAVIAGFAGIMIILQPASGEMAPGLLFAVLGALLMAVIQLMLKSMSGRDSTDALVGWNLILTVPLAALPALWFWTTPTWPQLGLLAIQGALGALNMTAITRSLALAPASFVAPFDFLRLPFVAILAFAFFGEVAGLGTWVGATIVFGSTLLLIGPIGLRNAAGRA